MNNEEKLKIIKNAVRTYEDFPKKGIIYRDIFGIFQDVKATRVMIDLLINHVKDLDIDLIVGLDSRGFLLGPVISAAFGKPFVPIRKKGKLPGTVRQQNYKLEYGEDTIEVQTDSIDSGKKVLIVDDLLATGGTLSASVKLLTSIGAEVVECLVIMELNSLNGREKLSTPIYSLIQYD